MGQGRRAEEGKRANAKRQIEKERMKGEGKRSVYLRIAADIMLICERGCMPDKPLVCACVRARLSRYISLSSCLFQLFLPLFTGLAGEAQRLHALHLLYMCIIGRVCVCVCMCLTLRLPSSHGALRRTGVALSLLNENVKEHLGVARAFGT